MDELRELRARIRVLEEIEAIKQLKARYWRCVDQKLWNEWADCFVEDAKMDIQPMGIIQGKRQIVQAISNGIGTAISTHQGHSPEIEITGDTTAKGKWALYDHIFDERSKTVSEGFGLYEDEYVKENGQWKIKTTRITHHYVDRSKKEG